MSCTCTGNSLSINRCANPLLAGSALRIDSTFCHFDSPPHRLSHRPAPKCRAAPRIAPARYIPYRTENYSASVRPPLPVSSPFRIAAARKHSALRRVHQPLLRAAAACAIPLRVRKVPLRKNRTGRPDAHTVGRTLRSQKPAAFHIRPLYAPSATIRRPPHRHKKTRPHIVRAPCPMLREKRSVAEKITSRYRS